MCLAKLYSHHRYCTAYAHKLAAFADAVQTRMFTPLPQPARVFSNKNLWVACVENEWQQDGEVL